MQMLLHSIVITRAMDRKSLVDDDSKYSYAAQENSAFVMYCIYGVPKILPYRYVYHIIVVLVPCVPNIIMVSAYNMQNYPAH